MGLRTTRHERLYNHFYPHPRTSERGGVLTINSVSGIDFADYTADPSGLAVIGIKLNDHWYVESDRMPPPDRIRRVVTLDGIAKALYRGDIITDWVHPDYANSIQAGDTAYAGPSGLLVNDQLYGGSKVGKFMSSVGSAYHGLDRHDSYFVRYYGLGLEYIWTNPQTKEIQHVNAVKIDLSVAGWVKLRINTTPGG